MIKQLRVPRRQRVRCAGINANSPRIIKKENGWLFEDGAIRRREEKRIRSVLVLLTHDNKHRSLRRYYYSNEVYVRVDPRRGRAPSSPNVLATSINKQWRTPRRNWSSLITFSVGRRSKTCRLVARTLSQRRSWNPPCHLARISLLLTRQRPVIIFDYTRHVYLYITLYYSNIYIYFFIQNSPRDLWP